jgi:hypothetical protein
MNLVHNHAANFEQLIVLGSIHLKSAGSAILRLGAVSVVEVLQFVWIRVLARKKNSLTGINTLYCNVTFLSYMEPTSYFSMLKTRGV